MEIHSRRIAMLIELDLERGSKEAHAVTIAAIAKRVGKVADEMMREGGYTVERSKVTTTLSTVRHIIAQRIAGAPVRPIKRIA